MAKGNWNEFDDPSIQVKSISRFNTENKSQRSICVQRTKLGKGGKTVTVITGLLFEVDQAKPFLKKLKILCGTGGTLKGDSIELQGDQVKIVLQFLADEGYRPKQIGG
tara:strand:+ start:59 stop:382 length:324 start_codon:yes stop_codon:yes gene_type:complete